MTNIYDDGFLRVEHENYFASCGGKRVKLARAEFLIVSLLVRKPERYVSAEEFWQLMWNGTKPLNTVSLHVFIYRVRRKFTPFGIRIETMVGVGYCLIPIKLCKNNGKKHLKV